VNGGMLIQYANRIVSEWTITTPNNMDDSHKPHIV
jgi:hypothetical protein